MEEITKKLLWKSIGLEISSFVQKVNLVIFNKLRSMKTKTIYNKLRK